MGHANNDEGRRRSEATSKARRLWNERNTCPACGRKGAITRANLPIDVIRACRWCSYAQLRDFE